MIEIIRFAFVREIWSAVSLGPVVVVLWSLTPYCICYALSHEAWPGETDRQQAVNKIRITVIHSLQVTHKRMMSVRCQLHEMSRTCSMYEIIGVGYTEFQMYKLLKVFKRFSKYRSYRIEDKWQTLPSSLSFTLRASIYIVHSMPTYTARFDLLYFFDKGRNIVNGVLDRSLLHFVSIVIAWEQYKKQCPP